MTNILFFLRKLVQLNKELISSSLYNKKNKIRNFDYFNIRQEVLESSPVFILSTGRCGTKLITEYFKKYKHVKVLHKPFPELILQSKWAYEQHEKDAPFVRGIFEGARYELILDTYLERKQYLETNNRITFFAHSIREVYPNARFIHIIREPYSFIKSGSIRKWYSGKIRHDDGRITKNEVNEWALMDIQAKISWLWTETNQFIDRFKETIEDKTKIHTIRFEDLTKSDETKHFLDLIKFIEPNLDINKEDIESIISKPVNQSNKKSLTSFELNFLSINKYLNSDFLEKYNYLLKND